MSIQVGHQLDPSPRPHPVRIAVQGNQQAQTDSKRFERGLRLVRDDYRLPDQAADLEAVGLRE